MATYGYLLMSSDLVLILGGATMWWLSPRLRRNWVLGYGSVRSMINDDTWRAANRFAGLTLSMLALGAMFLQVTMWPAIEASDIGQLGSVVLTLSIPFFVMYLTEKYLSHTFRN
jgi:uncharacterized membrane protein